MTSNIGSSGRSVILPESAKEKFVRRFKEEPLVPIGAALTTGALVMALVKMRRRESRSMNHWLRFRVIAQGFTICAIVGGSYLMGGSKQTKVAEDMAAERLEAERLREKAGFEERMKAAEEAHILEEQSKGYTSYVTPQTNSTVGGGGKSSSGWSTFGFRKTSPNSEQDATGTPSSASASASTSTSTPISSETAVTRMPSMSSEKTSNSGSGRWSWFGGKSSGSSPETKV